MPRVIALALVVVAFAMTACGKADKNEIPANGPAGKVVEMSGRVAATRNGASRTLALASEIFRDDVIETAGDGAVTIELFHNNARWSVESSQKKRVDESVAWGLDKQDAVTKPLDHATSAAGRNGERTAGDTATTVREKNGAADRGVERESSGSGRVAESKPMETPTAPIAPGATGGGPMPAPTAQAAKADTAVAPPPPPPPPPPKPDTKTGHAGDLAQPRGVAGVGNNAGGGGGQGAQADAKVDTTKKVSVDAVKALALLRTHLAELAACKGAVGGRLVVHLTAGKPTTIAVEDTTADLPCIRAIVNKLVFPKADLDLQLGLTKP